MKAIKIFTVGIKDIGTQFILTDHPELKEFEIYSKHTEIKRINVEQYFHKLHKDYKDYVKLMYGPVFGMSDSRNGFIYEHIKTEEILIIDENELPITYITTNVIYADQVGKYKDDNNKIKPGIITSYKEMVALVNSVSNPALYNDLIKDEWIPDKSFLIIE
jgi:transcription antitermination factor NusA-like protein